MNKETRNAVRAVKSLKQLVGASDKLFAAAALIRKARHQEAKANSGMRYMEYLRQIETQTYKEARRLWASLR